MRTSEKRFREAFLNLVEKRITVHEHPHWLQAAVDFDEAQVRFDTAYDAMIDDVYYDGKNFRALSEDALENQCRCTGDALSGLILCDFCMERDG